MLTEHRTSVISCRLGSDEYGYRAVCSGCTWKGRKHALDDRDAAGFDAERHEDYHADVHRLASGGGRAGGE